MKRRVVEQGGLTLMISLPRKWAKKHGLSKGDELELTERGKELVLATSKGLEEESRTTVEIDPAKFMGRLIHAPYRFGYKELEIKYPDPSVVPEIEHYLDQTLGYEIVEQGTNHMKIEMVASEAEGDFDKMLRRIMLLALDMVKDLTTAAEEGDTEKLKEIAGREKTSNKLTNYCERILNKHGYTDIKKTSFMYCTVWAMEQVVDDISDMCEILAGCGKKEMMCDILNAFSGYIRKFNSVFYKHPYEELWKFRSEYDKFMKNIEKTKAKTPEEYKVLALMTSATEKMRHVTISLL